jgi:caffeoyl-CoA O-methyltransferase
MIFQPEIEEYLLQVTPERPEVMREMETYAEQHDFPIVGPLVGRFLFQAARMVEARRVLELGSGFGYSAYWFALAMGDRGKITMIDGSEDNRDRALDYFERAGLQTKVKFKVGNVFEVLTEIDKEFDIIFNDIDKERYPETIDPAAFRLRRGGLFITDNLLWSGRVCEESKDEATRGVAEFTKRLYADPRFFTTILPLRDGVALAVRL